MVESGRALVLWVSDRRMRVWVEGREIELRLPGRWRQGSHDRRPVAPGDHVAIVREGSDWRATDIEPRRNEFTRRSAGKRPQPQTAAANLDLVLVVAAAAAPATPFGLADRLLVTAALGLVPALLVVNKCDLVSAERLEAWQANYCGANLRILFTSAVSGIGAPELREVLRGRVTLLAGASGVGKSSLANRAHPELNIRVGEISQATGKGRHITSSATLHPVPRGGWVIDTPGLRECAPWGLTRHNIKAAYPEIERLTAGCHFRNCLHRSEVGCAVLPAVGSDRLPKARYESYIKLLSEADPHPPLNNPLLGRGRQRGAGWA